VTLRADMLLLLYGNRSGCQASTRQTKRLPYNLPIVF
jgi:hypothetical protein